MSVEHLAKLLMMIDGGETMKMLALASQSDRSEDGALILIHEARGHGWSRQSASYWWTHVNPGSESGSPRPLGGPEPCDAA